MPSDAKKTTLLALGFADVMALRVCAATGSARAASSTSSAILKSDRRILKSLLNCHHPSCSTGRWGLPCVTSFYGVQLRSGAQVTPSGQAESGCARDDQGDAL